MCIVIFAQVFVQELLRGLFVSNVGSFYSLDFFVGPILTVGSVFSSLGVKFDADGKWRDERQLLGSLFLRG